MSKSWAYVLITVLASSMMFFSCKPKRSGDDPLPVVYSPSIIVGSNNQVLYALDPSSGAKNWELGLPCPITSSPILYGGYVYVASSNRDTVYKINAKTGEIVKKITFGGGGAGCKATPICDANLLYVASMNNTLYVIDTGTYKTKWAYSTDGPIQASPTIYNGNVFVATTAGSVYCLEKSWGTTTPQPAAPDPTWSLNNVGASFASSPAIADPYLFVGSTSDSAMYCLYAEATTGGAAPNNGILRWKYKTQGGISSSPATIGGTVIFGSNDFRVYCIDTTIDETVLPIQPEPRWVDSMHSEITSSPYAANGTVYVGCKDYKLYAIDMIGRIKWSFSSNGIITSSPLVYNGRVYIGSWDKQLYALDTGRGTLKWKSNINGQIECSPVLDDLTKLSGHNSQVSGLVN